MNYEYPIFPVDIERNFDFEYLGIGRESKRIQESIKEAEEHFFQPISRQSPRIKFNQLKHEWIEATKYYSSIDDICMHPAYQSIIGMGKTAIPLIIEDMLENYNHWFWALKAITGVDPVPPSKRGKIKEMTIEWFRWWLQNK